MSATSLSSEEFISLLISIQINLFRIGGPILIILGSFSCIFSLLIFTQKTLRKNPCSIYFIALYIINFLYIYSSLLTLTLQIGYNIDASTSNLIYCRFRLYIAVVLNCLNAYLLILAAIDRILVTSSNALIRRRSTRLLAYKCIIIGILFFMIFLSHLLIFVNIQEIDGLNTYFCYYQMGWYLTFMSYYSLFKETIAPLLMITFGLWSVNNIRNVRRIINVGLSTVNENTRQRGLSLNSSRDRQFLILIIKDVMIYILFTFIMPISLIYDQVTQYQIKNVIEIQQGNLLRNVAIFSVHIPFCIGFYTNLIVSKTFRHETKNIFLWRT